MLVIRKVSFLTAENCRSATARSPAKMRAEIMGMNSKIERAISFSNNNGLLNYFNFGASK